MTDEQIKFLRQTIKNGLTVVWNPDITISRVIKNVGKHPEEGEDPCGLFSNGEYISLYNVDPAELFITRPLFLK